MLLSQEFLFVFVHVPRAAGNAITAALTPYASSGQWNGDGPEKHFTAAQIQTRFFETASWEDYFSFAMVRNPWDQIHSDYHYTRAFANQLESIRDPNWRAKIEKSLAMPFEDFVALRCRGEPRSLIEYYCLDNHQSQLVTEIYRYEDLDSHWPAICSRCGVSRVPLPRVNATRSVAADRGHYRDSYLVSSRNMVEHHYRYDIERFEYEF